jgi:hypothetical protein
LSIPRKKFRDLVVEDLGIIARGPCDEIPKRTINNASHCKKDNEAKVPGD